MVPSKFSHSCQTFSDAEFHQCHDKCSVKSIRTGIGVWSLKLNEIIIISCHNVLFKFICSLSLCWESPMAFCSKVNQLIAVAGLHHSSCRCYLRAISRFDTSVICHVLDNFRLINFARFVSSSLNISSGGEKVWNIPWTSAGHLHFYDVLPGAALWSFASSALLLLVSFTCARDRILRDPRNLRVPDFRTLGSRPRPSRPRCLQRGQIKN